MRDIGQAGETDQTSVLNDPEHTERAAALGAASSIGKLGIGGVDPDIPSEFADLVAEEVSGSSEADDSFEPRQQPKPQTGKEIAKSDPPSVAERKRRQQLLVKKMTIDFGVAGENFSKRLTAGNYTTLQPGTRLLLAIGQVNGSRFDFMHGDPERIETYLLTMMNKGNFDEARQVQTQGLRQFIRKAVESGHVQMAEAGPALTEAGMDWIKEHVVSVPGGRISDKKAKTAAKKAA